MAQFRGTVKWFNNLKDFEFLGLDDGPDVFVHYSAIQTDVFKRLNENDEVDFDIITGTTGKPQADNVRLSKKFALTS